VLVGVGFLSTEYGAGLENAIKTGCHSHLLVELGGLCKVCLCVKVFYLENVGLSLNQQFKKNRLAFVLVLW
jgi:hypothetical protein